MHKFASECGAGHPDRLRGILLRKHIATNCHKLKLTEHEVSELANFMGHKENIHKQYYRLPQKEADILNISKYLNAAIGAANIETDNKINSTDNSSSDEDDSNSDKDDNNNDKDDSINEDNGNNTISLSNITNDGDFINNTYNNKVQENKVQMKCKRIRWNAKEKNIVLKEFNAYLNTYKCPTTKEIAALIAANPCLQTRTISQVKTWFNNQQKILRNKFNKF
ncbi:myb-like protein I [Solenopsis invicta]|uniref:myb-like protein I n=1 Tax=Solenopsis invicta TaxID=13686 RepID=UPI00193DA92E|nr:myb-like protein I [Solenopsis invicta]